MPSMLKAFDVDSYNKGGFNFGLAKTAGYDTAYIKLGGDNLSPRYRGTGYLAQFQRMCDAGFTNRGSYWISGGYDPVGSARFYLANLDSRTTFDVLDNEPLDGARAWTDAEAAEFFDVLIAAGRTNLFQYGSRVALWQDVGPWPELEKRRIKAIVADYATAPMQVAARTPYPTELIFGHQFADNSSIGGLTVDEDVFLATAFTTTAAVTATPLEQETDMSAIHLNGVKDSGIIIRGSDAPYSLEESVFVATANGLGLRIIELEKWQYDTVVREQWTAHASAVSFASAAVDPKSVDEIVAKLRATFPAPAQAPTAQ